MEVRCKVCGKPLSDPISIARGMGPKCAGIASGGGRFRLPRRAAHCGTAHPTVGPTDSTLNLFSFVGTHERGVPPALERFPADLLQLVLSAQAPGSLAAQIKSYSRGKRKQSGIPAGALLKQIRRLCIDFRLLFWPGLSMKLEPIPCIPCGENDWRIGENGRVMSKDELVAYLSRYGMISREQVPAHAEASVLMLAQQ